MPQQLSKLIVDTFQVALVVGLIATAVHGYIWMFGELTADVPQPTNTLTSEDIVQGAVDSTNLTHDLLSQPESKPIILEGQWPPDKTYNPQQAL